MHGQRYSIATRSYHDAGIEVEGWIGVPVDHTVQLTKRPGENICLSLLIFLAGWNDLATGTRPYKVKGPSE